MRELGSVAEQLRLVQLAKRRFMELWAVENECINPMLDRMADELLEDLAPDANGEPIDAPAGETL